VSLVLALRGALPTTWKSSLGAASTQALAPSSSGPTSLFGTHHEHGGAVTQHRVNRQALLPWVALLVCRILEDPKYHQARASGHTINGLMVQRRPVVRGIGQSNSFPPVIWSYKVPMGFLGCF
jgi:hypothetical protein